MLKAITFIKLTAMNTSKLALKIAAITGSAILLTGFVVYRSGGLDNLIGSTEEPGLPVDSPVTAIDTNAVLPLMPGSKAMIMIEHGNDSPATSADTGAPKMILPTSKSLAPVFTPEDQKVIAPSSKSGPVFTPADTMKR